MTKESQNTQVALRPAETAVVVVDLMDRIVSQPTHPHAGGDVLTRTVELVRRAGRAGILVVLVRTERPGVDAQPEGSDLCADLVAASPHVEVVKGTWGAFQATRLEAILDSAGARELWLCGISTNHGVESTARAATDIGFEVRFVEDCMSGLRPGQHEFAVREIFPMIGRMSRSSELRDALSGVGADPTSRE